MFRALARRKSSLRSWRDFARECFCFGDEAVFEREWRSREGIKWRLRHQRIPCQLRRLRQSKVTEGSEEGLTLETSASQTRYEDQTLP